MSPKFSLQPVLDFRHNRVEALEIELSQVLAEQKVAAGRLETLQAYQLRLFEDLHRQQEGDLDMFVVNSLRSNLKIVQDSLRRQQTVLHELEQQVAAKRQEVVGAKQSEETLITLKNKEVERFLNEQASRDNRVQDDIYIAQAFRRAASL